MAGLLDEDAGDFASARARYEASLGNAPPGALRDQIESRLDFVRVEELRADVRASLAREAELRQTTPDPEAVGIFTKAAALTGSHWGWRSRSSW